MILVKLGGSVLTDKRSYRTARPDAIARLAKELSEATEPLLLVHGAGSFGHVLAREHRLTEGIDGPQKALAAARVHADVRELHLLVLRALHEAGIPAMGIPPWGTSAAEAGQLLVFDAEAFNVAYPRFTPVTFGDVVPDARQGASIVSGDELILLLAQRFSKYPRSHSLAPRRVVFVTDVDGLHDRAPSEPGARLLETLRLRDLAGFEAGGAAGVDVTGGMSGKLRRIRAVLALRIPVSIVNGLVPGRVAAVVRGAPALGTTLEP